MTWVGRWGESVKSNDGDEQCQKIGTIVVQLSQNLLCKAVQLAEEQGGNLPIGGLTNNQDKIRLPSEFDLSVRLCDLECVRFVYYAIGSLWISQQTILIQIQQIFSVIGDGGMWSSCSFYC
eukprot:TRINITY_DN11726_c0_g1_i1.p1 TRINITY_DN11726_c0_g1~~TRINITY_DN11726_c0_g1_i1.p1  ORF type:complete len:136 (-),score=1.70 TRINITY_DN11726_c0_g1_i1:150-512(-)